MKEIPNIESLEKKEQLKYFRVIVRIPNAPILPREEFFKAKSGEGAVSMMKKEVGSDLAEKYNCRFEVAEISESDYRQGLYGKIKIEKDFEK